MTIEGVVGNTNFDNGTSALVAIKKMTARQQEYMLMDLAWKLFHRPPKLSPKQIVVQSYNTAIII